MNKLIFYSLTVIVLFILNITGFTKEMFPSLPQNTRSQMITLNRMPSKPEWQVDLTDNLFLYPKAKIENDSIVTGTGKISYSDFTGRKYNETCLSPKGETLIWQIELEVPAAITANLPVKLTFDEGRVIQGVWFNKRKLSAVNTQAARLRWAGGEGYVNLPPMKKGQIITFTICSKGLNHLYPNAFGRVKLCPATLKDMISITNHSNVIWVNNDSYFLLDLDLVKRQEDFFCMKLKESKVKITVSPRQKIQVELDPPATGLWKTIIAASGEHGKSWEYWQYAGYKYKGASVSYNERKIAYNQSRPEVKRLSQNWEMSPVKSKKGLILPMPETGWKQITLPYLVPSQDYKTHMAWFKTTFQVSELWKDKEILLFFKALRYKADIYIDNHKIASIANWQLPKNIDISNYVTPGKQHTLALGITDFIAALAPGVEPMKDGVNGAPMRSLVAAVGHMDAKSKHLGLSGSPELLAVPKIRTDWVWVRTYTQKEKRLEATLEMKNNTPKEQTVRLLATVLNRGTKELTVYDKMVTLPSSKTTTFELEKKWLNPVLWRPENPHLYEFRIDLIDKQGNLIDRKRERFGFREIGIDGQYFTLNGQRFHLYGSGHIITPIFTWPVIPPSQRIVRHHFHGGEEYWMGGIDRSYVADELGLFIKEENLSHNGHHAPRFAYHLKQTWDNIFSEIYAVFRAHPNCPSSFIWDIGNELNFSGEGEKKKMGKLYKRVRQMDPTRLVTNSGGSSTPKGVEVIDNHHNTPMFNRWTYWYMHPEKRPDYLKTAGVYSYRPKNENPALWREVTMPHLGYVGSLPGYNKSLLDCLEDVGGRPMFFSETMNCERELRGRLLGQVVYHHLPNKKGYAFKTGTVPLDWAAFRKYMIQFNRQAELAAWMTHVDRGYTRAMSPIAVFPMDRKNRFYSGQDIKMNFSIHNDRTYRQNVTIQWTLKQKGKTIKSQTMNVTLQPSEVAFRNIAFGKLSVTQDTSIDLIIDAWTVNGDAYFSDYDKITIFKHRTIKNNAQKTLFVYDPKASVTPFLEQEKVVFSVLDSPVKWAANTGPLLIGSDSLSRLKGKDLLYLKQEIQKGGCAIILDHAELPAFLDFPIIQEIDLVNTCVPIGPCTELSKGLILGDFRFWQNRNNDFAVYRNPLSLPFKGNFKAHLFTQNRNMFFNQTPLLEVQEGKGTVLFSQLVMQAALGHDPAADRLMKNILNWSFKPKIKHDTKVLVIDFDDNNLTDNLKGRIGLDARYLNNISNDLGYFDLLIISGKDKKALDYLKRHNKKLLRQLQAGSSLYIINLDNTNAQILSQLTGKDIKVEDYPHSRAFINSFHPLLSGLSHSDFIWAESGDQTFISQNINKPLASKKSNYAAWSRVNGEDVVPLLKPAFTGLVNVGKGKIIINQLRSFDYPLPKSLRSLSIMLSNAGAKLNPSGIQSGESNQNEKNSWTSTPINLRSHANRGFADDPGLPVRGWSAQGPENDMRYFPVGNQTFKGVDFDIIDPKDNNGRSLIALSGTKALGELPAEVNEIKVGFKADRLVFLHAAAWGAPGFHYKIWNEDRKNWLPTDADPFVVVKVKPEEAIDDWFAGGSYLSGKKYMTKGKLAWTGHSDLSKKIEGVKLGVFMMIWDNPHPEKIIEAIDIISPGKEGHGQPFVLAITALNRKKNQKNIKLDSILPSNYKAEDVFKHFQNSHYGFIILKNGVIPTLHDVKGKILFGDLANWTLQGFIKDSNADKVDFKHIDWQPSQKNTHIKESVRKDGTTVFEIKHAKSQYMNWSEMVECLPRSIKVSYSFEIQTPLPQGENTNLNLLIKPSLTLSEKKNFIHHPYRKGPIIIPFNQGVATLYYPKSFTWQKRPLYRVTDQKNILFNVGRNKDMKPGKILTITYKLELP